MFSIYTFYYFFRIDVITFININKNWLHPVLTIEFTVETNVFEVVMIWEPGGGFKDLITLNASVPLKS